MGRVHYFYGERNGVVVSICDHMDLQLAYQDDNNIVHLHNKENAEKVIRILLDEIYQLNRKQ